MKFEIIKSNDGKHKFFAVDENGKKVKFGAVGYSDYTIHKDDERKERYISRHSKEDWTDLGKAGTWSRYALWNKKTLNDSLTDMENKFGIEIKYKNSDYSIQSTRSNTRRQSPTRQSPTRQSPRRQSPIKQSPKRQSPRRQSPRTK